MPPRTSIDLSEDIHAIFAVDISKSPPQAISFAGTGFMVSANLLLTCWHCVADRLADNQAYIAVSVRDNKVRVDPRFRLQDVERDRNGSDLATARVDIVPQTGFELTGNPGFPGTEVFTFGFPLTEKVPLASDQTKFLLSPRYLGGHITRAFSYQHARYGQLLSYELSFMAPSGLSGAPLIVHGRREIIGVVYLNHDSYSIVEEATVDSQTGEIQPEVRRIVSFGLALHTNVVSAVRTAATSDKPLLEFLHSSRAPQS